MCSLQCQHITARCALEVCFCPVAHNNTLLCIAKQQTWPGHSTPQCSYIEYYSATELQYYSATSTAILQHHSATVLQNFSAPKTAHITLYEHSGHSRMHSTLHLNSAPMHSSHCTVHSEHAILAQYCTLHIAHCSGGHVQRVSEPNQQSTRLRMQPTLRSIASEATHPT